jgi:Capsule polysaccharide biosynthesis protein.
MEYNIKKMKIKKTIYNAIAPILLKLRWKRVNLKLFNNKELQADLNAKLSLNLSLKSTGKPKIIIGSIRSQAHSNLFEGAIGGSFKKAGLEVAVLRCGQFLKSCETKTHYKDNQISCSMCHSEFDYFKKTFQLDEVSYDDLIDSKLRNNINNFVNAVDLTKVDEWDGYSIQNEWSCALQRYYLSTDIRLSEKPEIARQFLFTTISSFEAGKKLVKKDGFTHLFTSHGIYGTWGGLVAGFRYAGGDVTVWGRGYYNSGIVSFKGESYLNGLKFITRDFFLDKIRKENAEEVKSYLEARWTLTNDADLVKYYEKGDSSGAVSLESIMQTDKKYIGFYPNIPWDGQAFVSTKNFRSLRDVLESLIKYADKHNDVHVIIRPHPAENPEKNPHIGETFLDITKEYEIAANENFTVLPYETSITSYDIAEKVKANVLFAGSIGLELAAKGLSVIQMGRNVSSNKDIYYEPNDYNEFEKMLDGILNNGANKEIVINEEIKNKALEWATFYYSQVHMRDQFFDYKGYTMEKTKDKIDDKRLSNYLDWILTGKELYYEE